MRIHTKELLTMGVQLFRERDMVELSKLILQHGIQIAECDGGMLYHRKEDLLIPSVAVIPSRLLSWVREVGAVPLPTSCIQEEIAYGKAITLQKIDTAKGAFPSMLCEGSKILAEHWEYTIDSLVVVPLVDDVGECNGVLELFNRSKAKEASQLPPVVEQILSTYATQAAIRRANLLAEQEVQDLLDSIVGVMSTAIDARTPYNTNHARNMVRYGEHFLDWMEETQHPWRFGGERRRQFLLSIWLHDVGKITIPLEVMDKSSRLGMACNQVYHRFRLMKLLQLVAYHKGETTQEEYERDCNKLAWAEKLVEQLNRYRFHAPETWEDLYTLASWTYLDEIGQELPWLTSEEVEALSIRQGTLTEQERKTMESHVMMTQRMLAEIKFPEGYTHVPLWAGMHHEFLDGSGYPSGLTEEQIPSEARLLTILDIFDALTARDRPYKLPVPVEKAVEILREMAEVGKLDPQILEWFIQSKPWVAVPDERR